MTNVVQHRNAPVAILDIGAMDHEPDQVAKRIGDDVALAALDFLASIEARDAAAFGGFDALAVDNASGWAGLSAFQVASRHGQMVADRFQKAAVTPIVDIALDGREWREVPRQQRPCAAARRQIKDRVHELAQIRRAGATDRSRLRQKGADQRPFPIGQVS